MEDIAPELYNRIQDEMKRLLSHAGNVTGLEKKIRQGKASQRDVARYADIVGQAASEAFKKVLKLEDLPDGKLYWNIAEKTIGATLIGVYGDVNTVAAIQLRGDDIKKGFNIGIKQGTDPDNRIKVVLEMASGQTTQEALDNAMTDPVISTARKFYDDFQLANGDVRDALGFDEVVVRHYDDRGLHNGKTPCTWCLQREGTFSMQDAHRLGVFERHPGCGCTIEVITPDRTQVQTDWTRNEWTEI